MAGAQQTAALPQQTVAVVMAAHFALQTDQICDVTFLHYHFLGVFQLLKTFIYAIHINCNTINFMLNSSFKQIEEFAINIHNCVFD